MSCEGLHCPGCGRGVSVAGILLAATAIAVAAKRHTIEHYADDTIRILEIATPAIAFLAVCALLGFYFKAVRPRVRRQEKMFADTFYSYRINPKLGRPIGRVANECSHALNGADVSLTPQDSYSFPDSIAGDTELSLQARLGR